MEQSQNDILEYLKIAARRKWFLIIPVLLGTFIAFSVALKLPPIYRSTTLILVEQQRISEIYVTPTDSTPFTQRLNTIQQQVMSRTNLEKIIGNFNLYTIEESKEKEKTLYRIKEALGLEASLKPSVEELVEKMRDDIEIKVMGSGNSASGGADAFRISYVGGNPHITMQVTNTLASLFIEENLKIKEQYAEGTTEFLVRELSIAKKQLEVQESAFRKFKERRMGALPEQLDANLRTLDRLQLEFQSVNESLRNAAERKIFLEAQAGAVSTVTGQAPVAAPLVELERLRNELAALLSRYEETYPDVLIVKNRIGELEEQLSSTEKDNVLSKKEPDGESPRTQEGFMSPDLAAAMSQIALLKGREARIQRQLKNYQQRVESTPANEQVLTDLQRDYDIIFQNYQSLLEKKLNANLAENLEKRQKGARFRIVDPANLPEKPFKPDRPKVVLMGTAAGVGIGALLIFLLEVLNPAFRKPEDFEGLFEQPVLATIPQFSKVRKIKRVKKLSVVNGRKEKDAGGASSKKDKGKFKGKAAS